MQERCPNKKTRWQRRWLRLTFSSTFSILLFVFDDAATPSPQGFSYCCSSGRLLVRIGSIVIFRELPSRLSHKRFVGSVTLVIPNLLKFIPSLTFSWPCLCDLLCRKNENS